MYMYCIVTFNVHVLTDLMYMYCVIACLQSENTNSTVSTFHTPMHTLITIILIRNYT